MDGIGTRALACLAAVAVLATGCGEDGDPGAANPESRLTSAEATAPLGNAAPELVSLREDANALLDGGLEAFQARLEALEGTPVVVNKWASWCGPCRHEFPFFQAQAIAREREVAFIGLLSNDGPATGRTFLRQLPLPYPSYNDPDSEIAFAYEAGREFPSTVFIDSHGDVVHTKLGGYADEEQLAADIDRYAR